MKYIKNKKLCNCEYIKKLHDWLIKNQEKYFVDENKACSESDFRYFNKTTDREHFCFSNEPMLIDRSHNDVHTYCICTISKYKETQRVTMQIPVIKVDELKYGIWRNGYWLLPIIK